MQPILKVEELTKAYRSAGARKLAVDRVAFAVQPGELIGLLGPNGAGKTTTIKCICGLVRPTSGTVHIDGVDARARPRAALERIAAVLEGNRNVYWRLTPVENLELFAGLQGRFASEVRDEIERLLERFGLGDLRRAQAQTLSRGFQQKLALACALVKRTPLLLLDEPTLGLDVQAAHELRAHLKELAAEQGRTVVVSSHDMDLVQEVCDRVVIIHQGRVVTDDAVANLLALFRARAYEFELAGALPDATAATLRSRFELARVSRDDDRTRVEVELLEEDDFYALVDLLRESRCRVESVQRREPNLEEVFLRIVREPGEGEGA